MLVKLDRIGIIVSHISFYSDFVRGLKIAYV